MLLNNSLEIVQHIVSTNLSTNCTMDQEASVQSPPPSCAANPAYSSSCSSSSVSGTNLFNETVTAFSSSFYQPYLSSATQLLEENWFSVSIAFSLFVLISFLYIINRPYKRFRRLDEIGYLQDGINSPEAIANATRRRRQAGDTPPPFPNGWYFTVYSQDLKIGEVKEVFLFGQQLAVFRGEDGKAAVLDAYCPHNGANMAVGGVVKDCRLQCPFHGWKFDTEGKCVEIPYSEQATIPSQAKVKKWHSLERNNQVVVWFHADGLDPTWEPREYPNMQGFWKMAGITENVVNCHIQEIPENGADLAHLTYLHSPLILSGSDIRKNKSLLNILFHNWVGKWYTLEDQENDTSLKHIACLELTHQLYFFNMRIPIFDFHVKAFQEGPALVYLTWEFALGKGAFCQTLNPMEPLLLKVGHTIWTHKWLPNLVARILMLSEISQVDRDIMIWNNKKYISKPLLVKEDKAIGQFRRWYSQFYSEGSSEFGKKNNMDW